MINVEFLKKNLFLQNKKCSYGVRRSEKSSAYSLIVNSLSLVFWRKNSTFSNTNNKK